MSNSGPNPDLNIPGVMLDLYDVEEDERITLIGNTCMIRGHAVFMVDSGPKYPDKADRYVRKVREKFPRVQEVGRSVDNPVPNVTTIELRVSDS